MRRLTKNKEDIRRLLLLVAVAVGIGPVMAQRSVSISIDAAQTTAPVDAGLHGIFFEEISHAGEGGLYAELIQNRGFEEANIPKGMRYEKGFIIPPATPGFTLPAQQVSGWRMPWELKSDYPAWHCKTNGTARASVQRVTVEPLNKNTPHSLQVNLHAADKANTVDVINDGFWGINVVKDDTYLLNFYCRTEAYEGSVVAGLYAADGSVLASQPLNPSGGKGWQKYSIALKAGASDARARFALTFNNTGKLWLDHVSLFPQKTFRNRPNGLRKDLAGLIEGMKPAFIRWPGGCFAEGITIEAAPNWKQTIGPVEERAQAYSPWGYYASNGFGYHEFLQFCEDIGAKALYVFNAGVSCEYRSGTFIADDELQPYIADALDAIEYAIGPVTSPWGKLRAANGHPAPFPLHYVEVGNEQSGPKYAARYNRFYEAIKNKYPQIEIMASMGIADVNDYTTRGMKQIDYVDEHAYKAAGWAYTHFDHFDKYPRDKWKMYVGEYATNSGVGNGNMEAALNDAVYMMSMEKNGDLVKMSSYAPLLVNVNDVDWPVNLIHFNSAQSFARISYYAIKMFNENRPSVNVATAVQVQQPAIKQPQFAGGIGLATWDTKTDYKDIRVIQNGKTVYQSNFLNQAADWDLLRGVWQQKDSALAQTAYGAQQLALLKQHTFGTYTLQLKARKAEGYNAFIIPFGVKDSNRFYRAHIGGWVNKMAVFEKVTKGYEVSNISAAVPLTDTIVPGRWYDIELQVGLHTVKCFLNGRLLMSYSEPSRLFAIAGKDTATGGIIIKLVNAYSETVPAHINIQNAPGFKNRAEWLTLSAPSAEAENSFDHPKAFVPVKTAVAAGSGGLSLKVPPHSINVIRVMPR